MSTVHARGSGEDAQGGRQRVGGEGFAAVKHDGGGQWEGGCRV